MCTIVLATRVFDDAPVCVAANRDEADGRPSEPPGRFAPGVVAPRDARAGGTWIGHTADGLFAAVTNRWTDADLPAERSRGLLVADALGCGSVDEAVALVSGAVTETAYAGFTLVVADADRAVALSWDGELTVRDLDPGVHVVVNVGADGDFEIPTRRAAAGRRQAAGARRARSVLAPIPSEGAAEWRDRAALVLADHDYGFCVHGDGFGTQSSSLVTLGPDGGDWAYADGPPCETAYRPVDGQV